MFSLQISFSFVRAAVACTNIEGICGFESALIFFLYLVQVLSRFSTRLLVLALSQLEHLVIGKTQTGNISAAYAHLSVMSFQSLTGYLEKTVKEGGRVKTSLPYSDRSPMLPFIWTALVVVELLSGAN